MPKVLLSNRRVLRDYQLVEKYIAGISLKGFEVKAIREGRVSFDGSFVVIEQGMPWLLNLYIGKYSKQGSIVGEYDPYRKRALLLTKREIRAISRQLGIKGYTAVPLAILLSKGYIKVEVGVVRGRKKYEKKVLAKEKQIKKDLERISKVILN